MRLHINWRREGPTSVTGEFNGVGVEKPSIASLVTGEDSNFRKVAGSSQRVRWIRLVGFPEPGKSASRPVSPVARRPTPSVNAGSWSLGSVFTLCQP